jgi:hypothetical protein
MSGALFAPLLAVALKKELVMVRKGADMPKNGHSSYVVEGYADVKRYVIVDDLVSTGTTAKYIHGHIDQDFAAGAKCVGVYCYLCNEFKSASDTRIEEVLHPAKSSVPKIEAADDPTVAVGPDSAPSLQYDLGRRMFVGTALPGFIRRLDVVEGIRIGFGFASDKITSVSDIPDAVDMEDVPSEAEAMDLSF